MFVTVNKKILFALFSIVLIFSACTSAETKSNKKLITASENGQLDEVKSMVALGADVNGTRKNNITALHMASKNDYLPVVEYLVSQGANMEAMDKDGKTPLLYAIHTEKYEVVKYLVSNGADYNTRDKRGYSALAYIALQGNVEGVKFLTSKGAQLNLDSITATGEGIEADKFYASQVVSLITSKNPDLNKRFGKGEGLPFVLQAAASGDIDIVKLLASKGADMNADFQGSTALHASSILGKLEVVKFLVSLEEININEQNDSGSTPLDFAIIYSDTFKKNEVEKFLLSKGAKKGSELDP